MEFNMFIVLIAAVTLFLFSLQRIIKSLKARMSSKLPPGSLGWPVIGETLEYYRAGVDGEPERFIRERMEKHDPRVFKTSLIGEPMIVFCGTSGHKFLYGNEGKAVAVWWPKPVQKLFGASLVNAFGDEAKRMRRTLVSFLNPDALKRYVQMMDSVTQQHMKTHWEGKEKLQVYSTSKVYAFELACRLFTSMDDPIQISRLAAQFNVFLKGILDFPINIPGTRFYYSMRAGNVIREELKLILKQRRVALEEKRATPTQDLVSHLLVTADSSGKFMTEMEIIDNILLLLFAGHDTSTSSITFLLKYLGELPHVYEKVLKEQIDIANSKKEGELLQWEDVQKMKYSWNVASEVLRLSPPLTGSFREALVDFTYAGYTIPKGWKLCWSIGSTHKDPALFPNPEEFDASRFEGAGSTPYSFVPFGGGPRMCVGQEFSRLEILVFLHNVVKRFRWDLVKPDEKVGYDPMLTPFEGLPIRLRPHQT